MSKHTMSRMGRWISAAAMGLMGLSGCGSGGADDAQSRGETSNFSTKALNLGGFLELQGTYGSGCIQRSGSWSMGLGGFSALANPALSVVKKNSACVLTLTGVRIGTEAQNDVYEPENSMDMSGSFRPAGEAFRKDPGDPIAFYANAMVDPADFQTNFTVSLAYSDDPTRITESKLARYVVRSGSAEANGILPPDYTVDLDGVLLEVDAEDVVDSATGSVALGDGSVLGERYVIADALGASPSYAEVNAAFLAGTASSISGSDPSLPIAEFGLGGLDLTDGVTKHLIIANEENGARSYQIIAITFNSPVL